MNWKREFKSSSDWLHKKILKNHKSWAVKLESCENTKEQGSDLLICSSDGWDGKTNNS